MYSLTTSGQTFKQSTLSSGAAAVCHVAGPMCSNAAFRNIYISYMQADYACTKIGPNEEITVVGSVCVPFTHSQVCDDADLLRF